MGELTGEPTKLLCSLPGIEQNVVSLLQTLTTFVSESRDRERCLLRRLDELSAQIVELKAEVRVSLEKKSAITRLQPWIPPRSCPAVPILSTASVHAVPVPKAKATMQASSSSRICRIRKQLERTWRPYPVAALSKK